MINSDQYIVHFVSWEVFMFYCQAYSLCCFFPIMVALTLLAHHMHFKLPTVNMKIDR